MKQKKNQLLYSVSPLSFGQAYLISHNAFPVISDWNSLLIHYALLMEGSQLSYYKIRSCSLVWLIQIGLVFGSYLFFTGVLKDYQIYWWLNERLSERNWLMMWWIFSFRYWRWMLGLEVNIQTSFYWHRSNVTYKRITCSVHPSPQRTKSNLYE